MIRSDPSQARTGLSRPVIRWLGGISSAVVVAVVSGVVLAYVTPNGAPPGVAAVDPSSPAPGPSDGPPFSVTTVARGGTCTEYLVDGAPAAVPVPEHDPGIGVEDPLTDAQVLAWERQVKAVPAFHRIVLTLQGDSARAVILQGIDVVVVDRQPVAKPESIYRLDGGCGAAVSPRFFVVDLDSPRATLAPRPGEDEAGNEIPAVAFPFTISSADPEIFIVSATPRTCVCTWYLRLRWLSQGVSGQTVIDNKGQPFRTAALDDRSARELYPTRGAPCATIKATPVGAWCELPRR